jgi:hypothetical protein
VLDVHELVITGSELVKVGRIAVDVDSGDIVDDVLRLEVQEVVITGSELVKVGRTAVEVDAGETEVKVVILEVHDVEVNGFELVKGGRTELEDSVNEVVLMVPVEEIVGIIEDEVKVGKTVDEDDCEDDCEDIVVEIIMLEDEVKVGKTLVTVALEEVDELLEIGLDKLIIPAVKVLMNAATRKRLIKDFILDCYCLILKKSE